MQPLSFGVNFLSSIMLATIWGLFAYSHLLKFQETHDPALLLFFLSETLTAIFFILRRPPQSVSQAPSDWLIAIAGTAIPLLFRPAPWAIFPLASILIIVGACLQILALISLNRSFAIVAAIREIKTTWMYRVVRHPIYASYCITFTGYILTNTTITNFIIYMTTMCFICMRIIREEKHLVQDSRYREYMLDVRYRLIPLVF